MIFEVKGKGEIMKGTNPVMKSILTCFLIVGLTFPIFGASPDTREKLAKPNTLEYIQFDANQIRAWVGNNGEIVSYNMTGDAGLEWPKGSARTAVFQSGLWVAGKIDGAVVTAACEYSSEFKPGKIIMEPGSDSYPDNPSDARYQVWSINVGDSPDPTDPNYNREYAGWPIADGAPGHDGEYFTDANGNGVWDSDETFEDYNGDGVYNAPDGDITEGEDPPLFIGDQVHWSVYNDLDPSMHSNVFSTKPMGIEIQTTLFGFDRADPLGNVMFLKWLVINKGGNRIDSTYISMWSDPDVGDANDDYVGCDTALSVGYCYNGDAVDSDYGTSPPCVGYDFFQGPIVPSPGDTALVSGVQIPDYKNLPMTSFVKYTNSSTTYPDPENGLEAFNYMKGFTSDGTPWVMPNGETTKFLYPGDPVTRSGYTEYDDDTPADRRFLMNSGPFTMEPWTDTNGDGMPQVGEPGVQEVVGAIVIAAGTNNLNAITAMKFFDNYAQGAYDAQFNLPSPPKPNVTAYELDGQIILDWEEGAEAIENYSVLGYNFEGYNIYQGESPNGDWKLIATYDKVNETTIIMDYGLDLETGLILEGPVQFGNNAGIQRRIDIRKDRIRGNIDLINGRKYYYAVTSYAYNGDRAPKAVECSKVPITVRPHEPGAGRVLHTETGDKLTATQADGAGQATVYTTVVNPLQCTGDTYAVRFAYDSAATQGYWYMGAVDANGAISDTLASSTELDSFTTDVIDGFKLTVKDVSFDPPVVYYKYLQTSNVEGTRVLSETFPAIYMDDNGDWRLDNAYGGIDSIIYYYDNRVVKVDTLYGPDYYWDDISREEVGGYAYYTLYKTVQHDLIIAGSAYDMSKKTALARDVGMGGGITDPVMLRSDLGFYFTNGGSQAIRWAQAGFTPVLDTIPFEVWDIERNQQITIGYWDMNGSGKLFDDSTKTFEGDWMIFLFSDYDGGNGNYIDGDPTKELQPLLNNPNSGWLVYFSPSSKYSVGDSLVFYFLNPVTAGEDEFRFTIPAIDSTLSKKEVKEQLKQINVFPNPYFGFNIEETDPLNRFVTFTHLPVDYKTTIRIFSLGGQLVRVIDHSSSGDLSGTTFEKWDLRNMYDIPVASGMYIVHIEVKGIGERILKLAVFTPEERLDVY
ncbi:MAG: hypothetical protein DRP96_00385 [Candidatus Neomarinimicrobiota bacterium]|nr:MAG: hypothetical protein DRP96_00385 [Candidatus Neomarinimicrobiota bacterium]